LPSEAQWEYACRAGTTTAWYCGDSETTLQEYGWFNVNSGGKTHPVGELKPNGWGLYDMHGNVWEWCADRWATDYYAQSPPDDPSGPTTGSDRVLRGGTCHDHARGCRSANRRDYSPGHRSYSLGFRLASVLADE
jgi:formylglycine-generating enzyme required for sulfatase activity